MPFIPLLFNIILAFNFIQKSNNKTQLTQSTQLTNLPQLPQSTPHAKITFHPDTTINKILILVNWRSIETNLGDVFKYVKDTEDNSHAYNDEHPFVYFNSRSGKEYLKMYEYEGSMVNEMSVFEVGVINNTSFPIRHPSRFRHFYTESGIRLGITKQMLFSIKGRGYKILKIKGVPCYHYEYTNKWFLQLKREVGYYAEYYFNKKGKLARFRFGFEYP